MEKEIKIIIGPTVGKTKVLVDNKQIGLIQDIKFHASVNDLLPEIEIVFPDLFSLKNYNSPLLSSLKESIELLKELPHVKVTLEKLKFDDS